MKSLSSRQLSGRSLSALSLAALLLVLLPFLLLARYDVPCADDYTFGTAAHLALAHGGGAGAVLSAALAHTADIYRNWQGSYSAVLLMSLQPGIYSESLYALTPWIVLPGLFGGLFTLCVSLMDRLFGLPRHVGVTLASLLAILYLLLVPYPAEGLYWYNGAVYYGFFHGLALLAIALALPTARRGGVPRILGLGLLALFLGGGNLVTGLSLSIVTVSALLLLLLERKRAELRRLLLPALLLMAGFLLNILAPGNAMRQESVGQANGAVTAILRSFAAALHFGLRWPRLPVLGVLGNLGLLFWAVLPGSRFSFRFPGLVSLWSYCLFSAMFCPTLYATGGTGPGRVQDIIFFTHLLLLALNLFYWLGWLRQRRGKAVPAAGPGLIPALGALLLCLVLLAASAALHGGINMISAVTSLRSGQAERYYRQAQERFAVLNDPSVRMAELRPYRDAPYLLFFDDVTEDPEGWQNLGMAAYYEKEGVVLLPEQAP